MTILGINGSIALVNDNRFNIDYEAMHDAGAVLVENGRMVCAYEEERLNRIKHTNKFPIGAIRACLERQHIGIGQVDVLVFSMEERIFDSVIAMYRNMDPSFHYRSAREYIADYLGKQFNCDIEWERLHFVNHHVAHAASTFYVSGFAESLILVLDGWGDDFSGGVYTGGPGGIECIARLTREESLGIFYVEITRLLGFDFFDEYKVMGLAPYGDRNRYREVFRSLYRLRDEGRYEIDWGKINSIADHLPRRRPDEPLTQEHKDIAAALQEALETLVSHILSYYRQHTGLEWLCLAGGVSLNCTMTGKLLGAGMFRDVFVQPASHDGGLPLGAALAHFYRKRPNALRHRLEHVYGGTPYPDEEECHRLFDKWKRILTVGKYDDIAAGAARLLADGHVIGWFQGCSEYGPRALGNRSILADPRPAGNKARINRKIKNREGFRPFAPSLLAERAADFFELPDDVDRYAYMTFILPVREAYRSVLGAITHVDGTARLHTVSRQTNPRYYDLIDRFGDLTGIPLVLNTSFNNHNEPIVDTPAQALNCFLTTHLDYLVIGDYLIRKKEVSLTDMLLSLYPVVPPFVTLHTVREGGITRHEAGNTYNKKRFPLSAELYQLLRTLKEHVERPDQPARSTASIGELIAGRDLTAPLLLDALTAELSSLWNARLIEMEPITHEISRIHG